MDIEIISIGDELLIGQVVNTNASWLASKCKEWGLITTRIIAVADEEEAIKNAIIESSKNVNFVILTGGLGPTKDDITKGVLCSFFDTHLKLNEDVLNHIKTIFSRRNLQLSELNIKQAEVPVNAQILHNELGTAPGMIFQKGEFTLVSLPGVPFEMKNIVEKQLSKYVKEKFDLSSLISETVMTCGIPESFLAETIEKWENNINKKGLSLAYLPQPGLIRLRITAKENLNNGREIIDQAIEDLKQIIPDYFFAVGDTSMEKVIGKLLSDKNKTVSTAESCTGGYISQLITSIPGSSAYYKGSVIAYDNEVKTGVLKVDSADLIHYGAVSDVVVKQMAEKVRELLKTDYSIAVSGIAGPDGGSEEKPVGTVWIAIAADNGIISKRFQFTNDRERNIIRASIAALDMLRKQINH